MEGKEPTEEVAAEAADLSIKNAAVLKENMFKVQVVRAFVRRAIAEAK